MVISYGPIDRNFPGLDRIFPEGKIRLIRGENPVSSLEVGNKLEDVVVLVEMDPARALLDFEPH